MPYPHGDAAAGDAGRLEGTGGLHGGLHCRYLLTQFLFKETTDV